MRTLLLCLTIVSGAISGRSQDNSPLTTDEGRRILGQLYELGSLREEVRTYQVHISRDAELDARETAAHERALELERKATAIAERQRELEAEKAKLYEDFYRAVTKKAGVGCRILRALTLGIHRCGGM